MTTYLPSTKVLNPAMAGRNGEQVTMIDVLEISEGDEISIVFESVNSPWHQGVWLATTGQLETNGVVSSQFTLWRDTASEVVRMRVLESDGKLRLYNVWDSGRGIRDHESQSATSGMLVEAPSANLWRYRCNDIGWESQFDKLVFRVSIG